MVTVYKYTFFVFPRYLANFSWTYLDLLNFNWFTKTITGQEQSQRGPNHFNLLTQWIRIKWFCWNFYVVVLFHWIFLVILAGLHLFWVDLKIPEFISIGFLRISTGFSLGMSHFSSEPTSVSTEMLSRFSLFGPNRNGSSTDFSG